MMRPPPRSSLLPYTTLCRSASEEGFGLEDGRTTILDGFSKTYAMTGWRLGYGVMPVSLAEQVAKLQVNSNSCTADRKSTRLNSSHANISYAVFCLTKNSIIH